MLQGNYPITQADPVIPRSRQFLRLVTASHIGYSIHMPCMAMSFFAVMAFGPVCHIYLRRRQQHILIGVPHNNHSIQKVILIDRHHQSPASKPHGALAQQSTISLELLVTPLLATLLCIYHHSQAGRINGRRSYVINFQLNSTEGNTEG
nr:hypothetical protein CFP56_21201 [Quercus suber]